MILHKELGLGCIFISSLLGGCSHLEKYCGGGKGGGSIGASAIEGEKMKSAETYPEITRADLMRAISAGEITVIDGNGTESYSEGHIPGALDYEAVGSHWPDGLPKDRNAPLVAYCGGPRCTAWRGPADALTKLGYHNVKHYRGGLFEWEESKMPMESSEDSSRPIIPVRSPEDPASIPSCTLSPNAQAARIEQLRSGLFARIDSIIELPGMLALRFEDNPANVSSLTQFIQFERKCCSSLGFTMEWDVGDKAVTLEMKGPEALLKAMKEATKNTKPSSTVLMPGRIRGALR